MKIKTHIEVADKDFYKAMFEMSHHHRVQLPYEKIVEYIEAVGTYNNFDAYKMKEFLAEMDKLIPRKYYNEGNLNNGQRAYELAFGRESSPVLYVKLFFFADVRNYSEVKQNWDKIKNLAESVAMADEISMDEQSDTMLNCKMLEMRMWWD